MMKSFQYVVPTAALSQLGPQDISRSIIVKVEKDTSCSVIWQEIQPKIFTWWYEPSRRILILQSLIEKKKVEMGGIADKPLHEIEKVVREKGMYDALQNVMAEKKKGPRPIGIFGL